MNCKHRESGNCILAKEIIKRYGDATDLPVGCPEQAFKKCCEAACPNTVNYVSLSLAVNHLRSTGQEYRKLLEESRPIIYSGSSCLRIGVGAIISRWLKFTKLFMFKPCACEYRATLMNSWGPDICEQRIDEIIGWFKEEAKNQDLPFSSKAMKLIIQRAINKSRKAGIIRHDK